ncbi:MAG: hypothetical protein NVSMB18_06560 [Acetobacteraceae bacterium]
MRIRTLLALAFALVAFAVAIVGAFAARELTSRHLKARIGTETADLAGQVRNLIDRSMYSRWRDVRILAAAARTTASTSAARREWVDIMRQTFPAYAWVGFADSDGIVSAATDRMLEGASVAARPWFKAGLNGPYVGDLHEATLLSNKLPEQPYGEPWRFVDLAAPVLDREGHVAGVVAAHLSWAWARGLTRSVLDPVIARSPGTDVLVLNERGSVMLGPPDLQGKDIPDVSKVWRAARTGDTYALETWPNDKTYVVGASRTVGMGDYPGLGWTVLVRQSTELAFAPASDVARDFITGGVILAGVAAMLGWVMALQIVRPLVALARAATTLGRSPAESEIPTIRGPVEVRLLSLALRDMLQDITERDRRLAEVNQDLERRVAARTQDLEALRDAAEAANMAKSRFLAGMSHELRTPLNGILGYAQLLEVEGELTAMQSARVKAMLVAGKHLLEMINRVLDLSEVESEHSVLHTSQVSIRPLVEDCLDLLRPEVKAKGLALDVSMQPGTPPMLTTDPTRLRQVLLNLLGNAVKFTSRGSIEVRILVATNGHLRIEVADTGPGIPEAQLGRLFQDFERLGADGSAIEGAGLGLALSARLAALLDGRLQYQDNPSGGSVFCLELPLVAGSQSALSELGTIETASSQGAPTRPYQILVADDVAMNREIATAFLERDGHAVVCVEDGAEAVEAVRTGTFDLVLMDVSMHGMDGLEATRRIRGLEGAGGQIPIVALTAQAFTDQVRECRASGMNDHLAKPFTAEGLRAIIQRTLTRTQKPAHGLPTPSLILPSPSDLSHPRTTGHVAASQFSDQAHPAPLHSSLGPQTGDLGPALDAKAAAEPPIFDRAVFESTAAYLDPATLASYLTIVTERSQALLLELPISGELLHGRADLADAAHTLAGSAGLFGLTRVTALARDFERALNANAPEALALAQRLGEALKCSIPLMPDLFHIAGTTFEPARTDN